MAELFRFSVNPWELIVRGTVMYWFLFVLLRFFLKRDAGSVGLADVLMVVVIADAAQNGMAGDYKSVSDAIVLVGTIAIWNYWIDWMTYRFRWFARFSEPRVVTLIRHGHILRGNLARNLLTVDEVQSHLRQNGIANVADVRHATLEPDGSISVIRYEHSK